MNDKLKNLESKVLVNNTPQGKSLKILKSSLGILYTAYAISSIGFILNKIPFIAKYSQRVKLFMGKTSL